MVWNAISPKTLERSAAALWSQRSSQVAATPSKPNFWRVLMLHNSSVPNPAISSYRVVTTIEDPVDVTPRRAVMADRPLETPYLQGDRPKRNPIVILGCEHFFTAETLDGVIGMSEVYKIDEHGEYTGLKNSSELSKSVPKCPDCNRPIQQHATQRCNRVINQAVIDEMSKRFVVSGQERLQQVEKYIEELDHKLDISQRKFLAGVQKVVVNHGGKPNHTTKDEIPSALKENYAQASQIRRAIERFRHSTAECNEPARRLHDATVHASLEIPLDARIANMTLAPISPIIARDKRATFGGRAVELKANYVVLSDLFTVTKALKTHAATSGTKISGGLPNQASTGLSDDCKTFISDCNRENLPKLAVEATCSFG
ncbi:hypothetical protein JHW43_009520 [Diplocarpon mali]|nr:hypothetical protein JHW43_009520 [Diplocarpon mali]